MADKTGPIGPDDLDEVITSAEVANRLIKNRDVGVLIQQARNKRIEFEKCKKRVDQTVKDVGSGWSKVFRENYWEIHKKMLQTKEGREHIMKHSRAEARQDVINYRKRHGLKE